MSTQNSCGALLGALLLVVSAAEADGPGQRGYHLFRPAPREKMRPLSADRPDATESTQTVDAGHVQLEIDVAAYVRDRAGSYEDVLTVAATNVKFGLTHNVDLQLVFAPYVRVETRTGGVDTTEEGVSNLVVRTKINLWGNDGGTKTSLALLPLVRIPLGGESVEDDDVTGGLIVPFGMDLPGGWGLGAQVGIDVVRNAADDGHTVELSQTVVVSRTLTGDLAGFLEFASVAPTESGGDWIGTLDFGVTYGVNEDVQLDVGVFVGVNRAAPDLLVFTGVTWRF